MPAWNPAAELLTATTYTTGMNTLTAEAVSPHRPADLTAFAGVDAWIFDLDNTLYPRSAKVFDQVDARIRA